MHKLHLSEAVADANKAIDLDPSNPKAYLRKGTTCFNLEEYQTAKTAFEAGSILAPEDTRFSDWIKKCDKFIAEENGELPTQSSDATPTNVVALSLTTTDAERVNNIFNEVITTPPKLRYRHEFYQKPEEVVVTIFAKGIPASNVSVNYGEIFYLFTIAIFSHNLRGDFIKKKVVLIVVAFQLSVTIDVPGKIHTFFSLICLERFPGVEIRLEKAESLKFCPTDNPLNHRFGICDNLLLISLKLK